MSIALFIVLVCFLSGLILCYICTPRILDFVIEKSEKRGFFNGPWKTHLGVGRKETPRVEKAAIARIGLGANSSDETIYWNAFTDSEGIALNTRFSYRVVIAAPLPVDYPNHGFWSITAYGADKFLMKNEHRKYMVRHTDFTAADYPLIIELGANPAGEPANHIPLSVKAEQFSLALRCYRPLDSMKEKESCCRLVLPEINRIV